MKILCIAILNRQGNPIYMRSFNGEDIQRDDVKYSYLAHTSCDVIEERIAQGKISDLFLGLLQTAGDMVVYGYVLNTGIRMILVMSAPSESAVVRSAEIRQIFQQIHAAYIAMVCNPFNETREQDRLASGRFDMVVSQIGQLNTK
ncbi:hypothetical protein J3B02_000225 [Coemansia erecta]|uniref:Trafficking protein particle complex subunit 2-like protein n=1 Tax=Coemansia asiatica TaxID=1052880 RepID=A0A9W8CJP4_9FUNG|nr:hypothetical protein LPJ64_003821 [Coemansia asiatica]KAJ2858475.1 hypothetical protein J3B02_000225 [Coemansia erecta]KAJ2880260.1 hypothetical protein FB639_002875 [Coemansia asiatica]